MPLADFHSDLAQIHADFPSVLKVAGWNVPCVASMVTQEARIDESGMQIPETWDIVANRRDFVTIPTSRQAVTLDGFACNVDAVEHDRQTDSIRLTLRRS